MALFARDERDSRGEALPPSGVEETRQAPRVEPVRERAAENREAIAFLSKGSRVSGKLAFDALVRVEGEVDGEISAPDTLIVEEGAVVTAHIVGGTVIVKGSVTGNVEAAQRLEIRAPGKLEGDVTTPTFVVHEGAKFDGRCSMGGTKKETEKPKVVAVSSASRA